MDEEHEQEQDQEQFQEEEFMQQPEEGTPGDEMEDMDEM
jgi:hypothetical protein